MRLRTTKLCIIAALSALVLGLAACSESKAPKPSDGEKAMELVGDVDVAGLLCDRSDMPGDSLLRAAMAGATAKLEPTDSLLPVFIAKLKAAAGPTALTRYFPALGANDAEVTAALHKHLDEIMTSMRQAATEHVAHLDAGTSEVTALSDHAIRIRWTGKETSEHVRASLQHHDIAFHLVQEDSLAAMRLAKAAETVSLDLRDQGQHAFGEMIAVMRSKAGGPYESFGSMVGDSTFPTGRYAFWIGADALPAVNKPDVRRSIDQSLGDAYAIAFGRHTQAPMDSTSKKKGEESPVGLYVIARTPLMRVEHADSSVATLSPTTSNPELILVLNEHDAEAFAALTAGHIGHKIAIVIDKDVFAAPEVQTRVDGGRIAIAGFESFKEAKEVATMLRSGGLPASITWVSENVR